MDAITVVEEKGLATTTRISWFTLEVGNEG